MDVCLVVNLLSCLFVILLLILIAFHAEFLKEVDMNLSFR